MEPAAIDFAATLTYIIGTSKLLALTLPSLDEARRLISVSVSLLGDQQASADYARLYSGFIQSFVILLDRFPELNSELQQVYRCIRVFS
jgi:hypothetical protein